MHDDARKLSLMFARDASSRSHRATQAVVDIESHAFKPTLCKRRATPAEEFLPLHKALRRVPGAVRACQTGVDEIYLGKKQKFITVASNLDSGEPVWFGPERKRETRGRLLRE